ncbi:hypothetical protein [Umezawaea sp. Da 62-37]|uniref:hypothetical protein n=1 Tax=Umezawaea sp. Da 62-37 TaxID=3075927 RepID=UPI0028F71F6D|nr:hypothetical protein [Umezawaea sp. Da 62-37]WNV87654.1 hypothetical protein RM788_04970 [Umezawaea sp. Da 62-37]
MAGERRLALKLCDVNAARDGISVSWIDSPQVEAIAAIIDLGDAHRRTLGMLPHEVFYEAASKQCLVAAFDAGSVVGT